jgi:hypothetical protein
MDRDVRLKMALELTRLVWDLKAPQSAEQGRAEQILDVFTSCYQRIESMELVEQPVVPAD